MRTILVLVGLVLGGCEGGQVDATGGMDGGSDSGGTGGTGGAGGTGGTDGAIPDAGFPAYPVYPSPSIAVTGLHFYVAPTGDDANPGSAALPWRTIQHAASSITTGPDGVTVHVAPGDYAEAVTVNLAGTSFTAPVRFLSDTRWGAHIDGGSSDFVWKMNGEYQEVVGFDVTGAGRLGIIYNASHVRVLANRVHDLAANACNGNGGAAIDTWSYQVSDAEVDDNVIFNIGVDSGHTLCNTIQGIYFATPNNRAYNNLCSTVSANCISSWHGAKQLTIVNNTVVHSQSSGILIGCGDSACVLHDDSYVANNVVVGTGAYGIQEEGTTGTNNRYVDNLVFANALGGISLQNGLVATGTIMADPRFVSDTGTVATGDYRLPSGSPAIDQGTTERTWAVDFDGAPRPYGAAFDLGAYEWRP